MKAALDKDIYMHSDLHLFMLFEEYRKLRPYSDKATHFIFRTYTSVMCLVLLGGCTKKWNSAVKETYAKLRSRALLTISGVCLKIRNQKKANRDGKSHKTATVRREMLTLSAPALSAWAWWIRKPETIKLLFSPGRNGAVFHGSSSTLKPVSIHKLSRNICQKLHS